MFNRKPPALSSTLDARIRNIATASPAPPAADEPEIRAERAASFKPGTLTFVSGHRMDVMLLNVSSGGARVDYIQDVALPERVLLTVPLLRLQRWAYVVWQSFGTAGLEFIDDKPGGTPG